PAAPTPPGHGRRRRPVPDPPAPQPPGLLPARRPERGGRRLAHPGRQPAGARGPAVRDLAAGHTPGEQAHPAGPGDGLVAELADDAGGVHPRPPARRLRRPHRPGPLGARLPDPVGRPLRGHGPPHHRPPSPPPPPPPHPPPPSAHPPPPPPRHPS